MVILAGELPDAAVSAIARSVPLVRAAGDDIGPAATALREASRITAPYVLVYGDPLTGLAAEWHAMWDVTVLNHDLARFEVQAAAVLAAWRAGTFELPDYYLVAGETAAADPDFYLGPLHAARPNRVAVAIAEGPAALAAEVLRALASLPHGPWWPPMDEMIAGARDFYPGSMSVAHGARLAPAE